MKKSKLALLATIVLSGLIANTAAAMPPPPTPIFPPRPATPPPPKENCEALKPVQTPAEKAYCSQPGHQCITNPLPYLQCLRRNGQ